MTGRNDLINRIVNSIPPTTSDIAPQTEDSKICARLKLILDTRLILLKLDAQSLLTIASNKRLRSNVTEVFKFNDSIMLWSPVKKKWEAGFRYLSDSGRNAVVERGNRLIKVPLHWIRKSLVIVEDQKLYEDSKALSSQNALDSANSSNNLNQSVAHHEPSSSSNSNVVVPQSAETPSQSRATTVIPPKKYNLRSQTRNVMIQEMARVEDIRLLNCDFLVDFDEMSFDFDGITTHGTFSVQEVEKTSPIVTPSSEDLLDEFGTFDLSRIPPRIYLQIPAARQAIRDELNGLLKLDSAGIPIGKLCLISSAECARVPKLHTTVVCKLKTNGSFKARICLRGDQQSLLSASFVSAPTASRDFVRWIIIFFVNHPGSFLGMIDISKAFTQSNYLNKSERIAAISPSFIGINDEEWLGHVATSHLVTDFESSAGSALVPFDKFHALKRRYCLLLYRPLYGSRDAPLRWWLKLSSELQAQGYVQFYSDCCLFGRYAESSSMKDSSHSSHLIFLVMLHVDDMLFCGSKTECDRFEKVLRIFDYSPPEMLSTDSALTFCGIEISYSSDHTVELSQDSFYSKITPIIKEDIVKENRFIGNRTSRIKRLKSFIGSRIWIFQTRYDIIFDSCRLATLVNQASDSVDKMLSFIKDANKLVQRIINDHVPLKFFPLPKNQFHLAQLIVFSDAAYASLRDASSIESCCMFFGFPVRRNGPIDCRANVVTFYSRRIARICRSSAQAESVALANAADFTLYAQCVLSEILFQVKDFSFLQATDAFPLMSPFKNHPTADQIRAEELNTFVSSSYHSSILSSSPSSSFASLKSFCTECQCHAAIPLSPILQVYSTFMKRTGGPNNGPIVHALLLSDCANSINSLCHGNPKTLDRCSRITTSFIQDLQRFMSINYCSAIFNMADVGTKSQSNLTIWKRFLKTGQLQIGFLSRKECKTVTEQWKRQKKESSFLDRS